MEWLIEFSMGAIFVIAYSGKQFNSPSDIRSLTTFNRYYSGLVGYVLIQLLFYCALSLVLWSELLFGWFWPEPLSDGWPITAISPILAALIVTIVMPRLPGLSSIDTSIRRKLHHAIGAPYQARLLGKILSSARITAPDQVTAELWPMLAHKGIDPNQVWFLEAGQLKSRWLNASVLVHQLWRWEREKKYGKHRQFLDRSRSDLRILRHRYDQISLKIARAIDTIGRIETMVGDVSHPADQVDFLEDIVEREVYGDDLGAMRLALETKRAIIEDLAEDIEFFYKNLCGFIARGILSAEINSRRREERLQEMGFAIPRLPTVPLNSIIFSFFVFFCVLFLNFALLGSATMGFDGPRQTLLRVTMITTVQIMAILIGGYPKLRYGFANTDILGRRPYGFFIAAGLFATLSAIPVVLVFKTLRFGDWNIALQHFSTSYPWLLMSFSTATTIAILVQENIWPTATSLVRQRIYDGLVVGATMMAALITVRWLLGLTGASEIPPFVMLLPGVVIGFLVGYAVPWGFRNETLSSSPSVDPLRNLPRPSPAHGDTGLVTVSS